MKLKHWVHGLVAATIGGTVNAIVLIVADPITFNLSAGLNKLLSVALVSGVFNACLYLKQSPLPPEDENMTIATKSPSITDTLMIFAICGSLLLSSCASVRMGTQTSLPYLRPSVSLVCGAVLNISINDPADRKEKAKWICGVAKGIRTLSTGIVPSVDEVRALIELWTPDKNHWSELSVSITAVYASIYPQIKDDPKLALQVLEQIALGCEDASIPYL